MKLQLQKATQQQTKTYNSQLVLKTIYDRSPISRAEVARLTHLTRTTVSEVVGELESQGLVREVGQGPSAGGRSPTLVSVVANARHLISVDLASDEFCGAVLNLRNEILHTVSVPIHSRAGAAALAGVYELVDALIAGAHPPVLGIGIGTPGLVDTPNGVVLRAVNLAWRDLPLGRLLQDRYGLPVYVANDSQVAALAHYMFGGEPNEANMVVIRAGHGVGAGIVLNGQLFQGDGFGAGEIGHIVVDEDGCPCRCGNRGCLETVVSSPAIIQRAQMLARSCPDSLLNPPGGDPTTLTLDMIQQALQAGDTLARQLADETGRFLGIAAANLVGALNIRHIILGGSVTQLGAPLRAAIQREMTRRALPALSQATQVELRDLGPDTVLRGAAALLLTHEFGLGLSR